LEVEAREEGLGDTGENSPLPKTEGTTMSRCLVIGDTHLPAVHPSYLRFVQDLRDKYKCDTVIHAGDVCDFHAISFHAHHPELPGPSDEFDLAYSLMRPWIRAFPSMKVCLGNHDARVVRLAASVNIPAKFIRNYAEVWETPGWDWIEDTIIDDVHYSHGEGCGGLHPAYNQMSKMLMSVAIGHVHTAGGVSWLANPQRRIFGLDVGSGIDEKSLAFAYGKNFKRRAIISAATVIDGIPQHHICPIGPGEKYSRRSNRRSK
jgi:predicted phosphodiesterase